MKIRLNPDRGIVKEIRERIKENGGYCPCSTVKNTDTLCMCKDFKNKIKENQPGECHCGLYVIEEDEQN